MKIRKKFQFFWNQKSNFGLAFTKNELDKEIKESHSAKITEGIEEVIDEKQILKEAINLKITTPFKRITYKESMEKYGCDKPDLRFKLELTDVTGKTLSKIDMLTDQADIDVSNVAAGIYLIKYTDDDHSQVIKINKQ